MRGGDLSHSVVHGLRDLPLPVLTPRVWLSVPLQSMILLQHSMAGRRPLSEVGSHLQLSPAIHRRDGDKAGNFPAT
ncbi:hypothetical protein SZ54_0478 [Rhizobium sp. UR51a]|nr:hypothetical protein SZ54_0478 [Rhizobium sp. UR51a]